MSTEPVEEESNIIAVSGPVTLYESTEVRELLLLAVSQGRDFQLDLEMSGPWDLAGLQLLVSTMASARKLGLKGRLSRVPRVCREVADRSGLAKWLEEISDSAA